jgi:hypothetical protein
VNAAHGIPVKRLSAKVDREVTMFQPRPEPTFPRARSAPSASSVMAQQLSDQIHEPLDYDDRIPEPIRPPQEPRYRPQPQQQPQQARRSDMDWTSWAIRSQQVQERLAMGFERVVWGGVGALAGAAVGGVPAVIDSMRPGYPFVFSQSLGATVGAIGGILIMTWLRSRAKGQRRRAEPQGNWTPRNQEASWS